MVYATDFSYPHRSHCCVHHHTGVQHLHLWINWINWFPERLNLFLILRGVSESAPVWDMTCTGDCCDFFSLYRWPDSAACSSRPRASPCAAWWTTIAHLSRSRVALSVPPSSNPTPIPYPCPLSPPTLGLALSITSSAANCKAHISVPVFLNTFISPYNCLKPVKMPCCYF